MIERDYWVGFSAVPGMGPAKFKKLLGEFKTAKKAWSSAGQNSFLIEEYLKKLKEKNVWFVTLLDEDYPELLKKIKNPPFVLYGKGEKSLYTIKTLLVL